jgi:hypothetical protein
MKKKYSVSFAYHTQQGIGQNIGDGEFEVEGSGLDLESLRLAIRQRLTGEGKKVTSIALINYKRRS